MSTTVIRNWNLLLRNENNVTRVYYSGYDKNDLFINSYVDLSQSIIYSGYTDTYMLEQFILPALNSAISDINLTIPNTNNYLSGNSNSDSYYVGSLQNNNRLTSCKLMCITLSQTVTHTDVESVDYTNILTNINTNLTNLNINIVNKNNQSDIVDCLKLIFVNRIAGVESSVLKINTTNDAIKTMSAIPVCLSRIAQFLNSDPNFTWTSSNDIQYRVLDNISKKLANSVPNVSDFNNKTILRVLDELSRKLSFDYPNSNASDVSLYKQLLNIKGSLKDGSDLHTISQAIDLISTAIAQIPTTDVSGLTSAVQNLHLESNNLIQVEGDIDYRIKYDKDKE